LNYEDDLKVRKQVCYEVNTHFIGIVIHLCSYTYSNETKIQLSFITISQNILFL